MPESPKPKTTGAGTLGDLVAEKLRTLSPTDTVAAAGDKMRALQAEAMPVSEGRRLVGIVDQPHPDRVAAGHGHDPTEVLIGESMNRTIVYCFEDQNVAEALRIMEKTNLRELPVVDRQLKIVGMVSRKELEQRSGTMPD